MGFPTSLDNFIGTAAQGTSLLTNPDHSLDHRLLGSAALQLELKLGIQSSNPLSNQILVGQGAGRTQWGTVWTNGSIVTPNIAGGTISNPVIGTPTLLLGSDAQGDVYYQGLGTNLQRLPASGTVGYFLQSQGTGADPTWGSATGIFMTQNAAVGTYNGTDQAYVDVVDGSITLTPTKKANIFLQSSGVCKTDGQSDTTYFQFISGTNVIGFPISVDVDSLSGDANTNRSFSLVAVNSNVGAGTYTYRLQTRVSAGVSTVGSVTIAAIMAQ